MYVMENNNESQIVHITDIIKLVNSVISAFAKLSPVRYCETSKSSISVFENFRKLFLYLTNSSISFGTKN